MGVLRTVCLAAFAAVMLTGCETPVQGRNFPDIAFTHKQPYRLDVATIDVQKQPPMTPEKGTLVHELPVSLADVAEKWARQRLQAVGQSGTAIVRIEKATVVEEKLKKTGGIRGAFTTDQTERYIGELEISVSISDNRGEAMARAGANRTRSIAEDATLAERERLWFDLVERLARETDEQMDQQIPAHLGIYLR